MALTKFNEFIENCLKINNPDFIAVAPYIRSFILILSYF